MKITGILIAALALVVGILPQFTDCLSQGKSIALPNGASIPMKCHWTSQAELALAVPLLALGGLVFVNRRREALRSLAVLGGVLGALVILVPTTLIGVCGSADMLCNMVERPALIFAGILVVAIGVGALVSLRGEGSQALAPGEGAG
jgi:uncharacterized membrane protein